MKSIRLFSLLALMCGSAALRAQEPLKVATVDMAKVFSSFYKSKEAEGKVVAAKEQARKEYEERVSRLTEVDALVTSLSANVNRPGLTERELADKINHLNGKLEESEGLRAELQNFSQIRQSQIAEMANRFRAAILEEINKVIEVRVAGYDLVFDSSANSIDEVKMVLFHKETFDLTSELIAELASLTPGKNP